MAHGSPSKLARIGVVSAWSGTPYADHIEHAKQHAVQARQHCRAFDNLVDDNEPLYKAVLCTWRWFALALPESTNDGDDNIAWDLLRWIQVLDQGRDGCLV